MRKKDFFEESDKLEATGSAWLSTGCPVHYYP